MSVEVSISSGDEFAKIRARAADVVVIGRIIARILETQAQKSFLEQRLGDFVWPERYPNQEDPFVNIAAVVNWTQNGGQIQPRFFDRRPALMGTGGLVGSISGRAKGKLVEVGSALPYAANHQWGLASSQPVGMTAKKTIAKFIGEEPDGSGGWRKKKNPGPRQKEQRDKYWFKLAPVLGMTELTTDTVQRPFLGITPQNEDEMRESIEDYVVTGDE